MNFKEALTEIEKLENGADILTAIKNETSKLNLEAKTNREEKQKTSQKVAEILSALGIADDDGVMDNIKGIKSDIDGYKQSGKTPSDVQKEIARMSAEIGKITKQLGDANAKAEAERNKRIGALKHSKLVDALVKNKSVSPDNIARLLENNIVVDDTDNISFVDGDNSTTVEEGVSKWLENNAWAIQVNANQGAGSRTPNGVSDPFLEGLNS